MIAVDCSQPNTLVVDNLLLITNLFLSVAICAALCGECESQCSQLSLHIQVLGLGNFHNLIILSYKINKMRFDS